MDIRATGSLTHQRGLRTLLEGLPDRPGGGPGPRLLPVLPPHQPGRGEASGAAAAQARAAGPAPEGPEGSIAAAVRRLLREDSPRRRPGAASRGVHRARPHRASDGGAPSDDARGAAPLLPAPRPPRRPALHARRGRWTIRAACARRSRSCGAPRPCASSAPRPWTRCARRSSSSTSRSSWSRPACTGRSTARSIDRGVHRGGADAGAVRAAPAGDSGRPGPDRRRRGPSCAGAPGRAPIATGTLT